MAQDFKIGDKVIYVGYADGIIIETYPSEIYDLLVEFPKTGKLGLFSSEFCEEKLIKKQAS